MKHQFFTVTVAPLTVLPFRNALFSYQYTKSLAPGIIVTIPLSGRTIQGVVFSAAPSAPDTQAPDWLKSILSVEDRPPLTSEQLALAQAVSDMNFTPLGRVLKHFVPKVAQVRKKTEPRTASYKAPAIPKNIQPVLAALKTEDTLFFPLSTEAHSLETLGALVYKLSTLKKDQLLFVVPDIAAAVRVEKAWETYFAPGRLVSLYHTKSAGQYYEAWNHIQTGVATVIIATRHGMFAPFQNLRTILQLDPHEESYKQWDMSPRYHAQFVLPALQAIWGAKLIQTAPLPSLFALAEKIPLLPLPHTAVNPEWINLKIERWQKNWGVFAAPVQEAIRVALVEKQQVLLYVHQSGLSSFSVCTECRAIFRCPSCNSTLKLTSSDHYQCSHCHFKSSLFPQCPACKSIHFKTVGYGTDKVAKEVQKLFPGASVAITDKKHLEDHKKVARFLEKSTKDEPDILVTTASFLRFPPLSRLVLIAIIDADTLLNLPGYRKDEQFVELIERAKSLVRPKGRILVQTYHPHSDIFQKIDAGEPLALLAQLLAERAELRYPPCYRALVLEVRPKRKDAEEALKSVSKKLKELVAKHPRKKELLVQSAARTERGKKKTYTLLRYQAPLPPEITDFLARQTELIFIDHDPLHIT